jgi:hypothetical protein
VIKLTILTAALLALPATAQADDLAVDTRPVAPAAVRDGDGVPDQLDADQRSGYRRVFAAIRAGQWADAQLQLDSMKPGPLHALARAEIYTAKNSPKVDVMAIMTLLAEAPDPGRTARADGQGARGDGHPCPARRVAIDLVRRCASPPARALDQERYRRDFGRDRDPALRQGR